MRWLCATAGILAVFAAGAVWIYFRDWQRPRADAAERALALIDGKRAFCCGHRRWQRVEILDTDGERHWRLRLSGPRARRCYWLDLDAFEPISAGRFAGIRRVRCGAAIAALGPPRSPKRLVEPRRRADSVAEAEGFHSRGGHCRAATS